MPASASTPGTRYVAGLTVLAKSKFQTSSDRDGRNLVIEMRPAASGVLDRIGQRPAGKERVEIGQHAVLHRHMRFQGVTAKMR